MNEEELKAKAEELEAKEGELSKKEKEIEEREQQLALREADAGEIAKTLKEEFEKTKEAMKAEYEDRLKQRDEVIRQLASGDQPAADDGSAFAELNKKRRLQKAA